MQPPTERTFHKMFIDAVNQCIKLLHSVILRIAKDGYKLSRSEEIILVKLRKVVNSLLIDYDKRMKKRYQDKLKGKK